MNKKRLKLSFVVFMLLNFCSSAYAITLANGLLSFEIPSVFEMQSQELSKFEKAIQGKLSNSSSDNEPVIIMLQQKGYNEFTPEALSRYGRIIIKIISNDANQKVSNIDFKTLFENLPLEEKNIFHNNRMYVLERLTPVNEWLDASTETVGGKFAVRYHYNRKSTSQGKGLVDVVFYLIIFKDIAIELTCTYRYCDENIYKPAIQEFLNSLKINAY